ncbi:MAG: hypothetical protein RMZ69_11515 [Nostoc sp. ChiQUE01a]|nr:hypothetical protein [Nostoc sp. ChiQUE01a]
MISDTPEKNPYLEILIDVLQEHLRQARQIFNLSLVAISTFLVISIIGAFLLMSGKTNEGTISTATGVISATFVTHLARESSQKLTELRRILMQIHPKF